MTSSRSPLLLTVFVARFAIGEGITVDADATDDSAGGLPAIRVETPAATYYLETSGGGLSSLIDPDGNDWLAFEPTPGTGARGEYRGFPNAVHAQPEGHFHPRNAGTDPVEFRVVSQSADHVTVEVRSLGVDPWVARYVFDATCCTFTMTRIPKGKRYWVLYEGVPGGKYDDDDWRLESGATARQPLSSSRRGDLPGPEWVAFGDREQRRALLLVHHADDVHPDDYFPMQRSMTVFGFGRSKGQKFLDSEQSFSIGLIPTDRPPEIRRAAERWLSRGNDPE